MPDEREPAAAPASEGSRAATADAIQAHLGDALHRIAALVEAPLAEAERGPLLAVQRSLQTLPTLVEALVRPAGFHSGSAAGAGKAFSLRDRLAQLFQDYLAAAREHSVLLRLEVDPDVPDILVGDADNLLRVLGTAVGLAIGHAANGEIVLHIDPEFLTQTQASLAFSVAQPGIFSTQAASELVAHLGWRAIREQEARGRFAFSCQFGLGGTVREEASAPKVGTLAGMRVLIAIGSGAERAELTRIVRAWHLLPSEADSGEMVVSLLDRARMEGQPIPLVLLGNPIQGEDGFLLALRIKRHPRLASTSLIMLTGQGRPGDAIRCRENGVAGYLPQPASPADLIAAITSITGATTGSDNAPTLVTRHSLRESRHGAALLLVGADREEQLLLSHFLAETGFGVTFAAGAAEAIRAAQRQHFDVALLSAELPDVDVLPLVRALRDIDQIAGGGALLLALGEGPALRERAVAAGIDVVLERPVSKAALLSALSRARM